MTTSNGLTLPESQIGEFVIRLTWNFVGAAQATNSGIRGLRRSYRTSCVVSR